MCERPISAALFEKIRYSYILCSNSSLLFSFASYFFHFVLAYLDVSHHMDVSATNSSTNASIKACRSSAIALADGVFIISLRRNNFS